MRQNRNHLRPSHWIQLFIGLLFLSLLVYTLWDNNRVVVVEQEIEIENLPASFDGYKVLLMSDLHGKRFGKDQKRLLSIINNLDYDALFIAGDMHRKNAADVHPFVELLDGLEDLNNIYYVPGNWGPLDVELTTGEMIKFGRTLQSYGVTLLTIPAKIERNEDHVWFVPYFSYATNRQLINLATRELAVTTDEEDRVYYQSILDFQTARLEAMNEVPQEDILIGMMHIPLSKESLNTLQGLPAYDLVLAGHFHGGQIRLPYVGAIYVPNHYDERGGLFPDNNYISGLYKGTLCQQYVTRGLGATSAVPFLNFRFYNPPEINVITLKTK